MSQAFETLEISLGLKITNYDAYCHSVALLDPIRLVRLVCLIRFPLEAFFKRKGQVSGHFYWRKFCVQEKFGSLNSAEGLQKS